MDDAAVVAALVGRDLRLLFQDDNLDAGAAAQDLPRGCQPDEAGSDNRQVGVVRFAQKPAARRRRATDNRVRTRRTTQKSAPSDSQRTTIIPADPIAFGMIAIR